MAGSDPLPGTAMLPGWLGHTLLALVTNYTGTGQRVLVLAPPSRPRASRGRAVEVIAGWFGPDEFAGLGEAAWALSRLRRSVDTATAGSTPDYPELDHWLPPAAAHQRLDESGSGLGPSDSGPAMEPDADRQPDRGRHYDSAGAEMFVEAFDLIITAAHPHDIAWLSEADWGSRLTPDGMLAVVTYSDSGGQAMLDSIHSLVHTFRNRGLCWWDQIALLTDRTETARTDGRLVVGAASGQGQENYAPLSVKRVHHDLLLFVRPGHEAPADGDISPGSSDREDGEASDD